MARKNSDSRAVGEIVKHWGLLTKGIAANAPELAHLDGRRLELDGISTTVLGRLSQQKAQLAAKQDITREIESLLNRGSKIASFLRLGVREHYGTRAEKLVEFDLQPFRGKTQPAKPPVIETKPAGVAGDAEPEEAPAPETEEPSGSE